MGARGGASGREPRVSHSVLKVARTIADLAASEQLRKDNLLEAMQHRLRGEEEPFWHHA